MGELEPERADGQVEVEAHDGRCPGLRWPRVGQVDGRAQPHRQADLAEQQDDRGDPDRQGRGGLGFGNAGAGKLHVGVHRQGVRMVGQQHGRAVLADRAQPREQHPGADAGSGDPQADQPEPGQRAVPERGREIVERRVDAAERGPGGNDEERRGDEGLRDDDPGHRVGEAAVEELPQRGVRPDEVDQHDAAHDRRHGQRQLDNDADDGGQRPAGTRQPVGQRNAEQRDQRGAHGRGFHRDLDGPPQSGGAESAVVRADQPDDKRDQRNCEVKRQQPAQPSERAA